MTFLLEWLAVNSVTALALAAVAALVGVCCPRRPALRHALWLLVLVKLLTPPVVVVPFFRAAEPARPEVPDVYCPARIAEPAVSLTVADPVATADTPAEPTQAAPSVSATGVLLTLWLSGAALFASFARYRVAALRRLLDALPRADDVTTRRVGELASLLGLRSPPEVRVTGATLSPLVAVLGGRARMVVPSRLWASLDADQRDTLVLHELAHLLRGDPMIRRLELVVLALYWWNPLAWWAASELHSAAEECCDAVVVETAPSSAGVYASALVETLAFLSGQSPRRTPDLSCGVGPVTRIRRRLDMILRQPPRPHLSRAVLVGLLAAACCLLPLAPGFAQEKKPEANEADALAARIDKALAAGWHERATVVRDHFDALTDVNRLVAASKACLQCHTVAGGAERLTPAKKDVSEATKLHDLIVKLQQVAAKDQAALAAAKAVADRSARELRDAVAKYEELMQPKAKAAPKSSVSLLEEALRSEKAVNEHRHRELTAAQREIEMLRLMILEMRKRDAAGNDANAERLRLLNKENTESLFRYYERAKAGGAVKLGEDNVLRQTSPDVTLPMQWRDDAKEVAAVVYVSNDGGKSYRIASVVTRGTKTVTLKGLKPGAYSFYAVPLAEKAEAVPETKGQKPAITVVVEEPKPAK